MSEQKGEQLQQQIHGIEHELKFAINKMQTDNAGVVAFKQSETIQSQGASSVQGSVRNSHFGGENFDTVDHGGEEILRQRERVLQPTTKTTEHHSEPSLRSSPTVRAIAAAGGQEQSEQPSIEGSASRQLHVPKFTSGMRHPPRPPLPKSHLCDDELSNSYAPAEHKEGSLSR
mmetsp:Transcript_4349/g.6329  ORF Transcript_4349/g.6329 Transcript_4349/m.6329 type:complete len:173 (+) Transcript_4349:2020-2538(+)